MTKTASRRSGAPPAARPRSPGDAPIRWIVCAVAFAAAFLERWWFSSAWHESGSLSSAFYYGDARRLVEYAIAILQGQIFDNGIPFHPPGWPLALAGFLTLIGSGGGSVVPVAAVKLLLAVLSASAVAVATLIAYDVAGPPAMLIIALLGPFHFGHIVEGTVADTEALYSLCVAVVVFAAMRAATHAGPERAGTTQRFGSTGSAMAWTAIAGIAGGYAMIVRAEFVACAIVIAACIAIANRRRWLLHVAVFGVLYAAVLVPTTIWHWRTLGAFNASHAGRVAGPLPRLAPVTSYGPFNFAMANHENSDGGPNRDHPVLDRCNAETEGGLDVGQLDLACPAVYDLYVHGYRIGAGWMLSHPLDALALMAHKLSMASGFLAHGYLADDIGAGVDGTRRRVDLVDPSSRILLPVHLVLLLAGLWILRRQPLTAAIIAAPLVAFVASTILFYGYVRLGTSYLPVVWVVQAAAIAKLLPSRARPRNVALFAGAAIVLLLGIEALRLDTPRTITVDGPRNEDGVVIQDETVDVRR